MEKPTTEETVIVEEAISEEQIALETLHCINSEKEQKGLAILDEALKNIAEAGCDLVIRCEAEGTSVKWNINIRAKK